MFRVVVGDKVNHQDFIDEADGIPSLAARRLTKFLQHNLSTKLDFYKIGTLKHATRNKRNDHRGLKS